jgi:hypothetical protein
MSEEQQRDEETEVEAHRRHKDANFEPDEAESDDEVEAHISHFDNIRME